MSSRFERVSRIEIEPNELHAYVKNIGTLNRLSVGILKNFARVLFVFPRVENLQHQQNTSKYHQSHSRLLSSLPPHKPNIKNINPCPKHHLNMKVRLKANMRFI